MPILAIDLGTTNAKAAVVDASGALLGTGQAPVDTHLSDDGGAEQDPHQIWEAVTQASAQALDTVPDRSAVRAVICASQYSSIVPVDADGQPTDNLVLWMDKRGAPDRLEAMAGGRGMKPSLYQQIRWLRIHGIPPLDSGADSLSHMRWIKLGRPEAYARTASFLEPMDYVSTCFSGRRATNRCSSFLMLLTDTRRPNAIRYHDTLVQWSKLDADRLPELVSAEEPVGPIRPEVAARLGLSEDVQVLAGINDTQAGGFGAYAFRGNHAGISIGTTGTIVTHVDFKRTDLMNSIATMPSPIEGQYFVLAEPGVSGRALEHFLEHLVFADDAFGAATDEEKYAALERAAMRTEPGSGGVLFLPWLAGSGTPAEDSLVRGGFLNISLQTTREHMARAVLEGVAYNFRWVLGRVERFSKRPVSHVLLYGGGAQSVVWAQILADVLGLSVHCVGQPSYAVSRGAALLGFYRLGQLALEDVESRVPIAAVVEPRDEVHRGYERPFEQFVLAFKRNRKIFRALNAGR